MSLKSIAESGILARAASSLFSRALRGDPRRFDCDLMIVLVGFAGIPI
jgi:hypothetical protein